DRGRELFQLALQKNRVLHVEHLALLSDEHQRLKRESERLGPLIRGEYLFQGGWNSKLADTNYSGPYSFLAEARLVQVAELFGSFQIASHRQQSMPEGFSLHLHLEFHNGGILGFTEERRVGLPRRRGLIAECEYGVLTMK